MQLFSVSQQDDKTIYRIDEVLETFIDKYFHLEFEQAVVRAPYFINTKRRKDLRSLVGKGTPEEMVLETKVWSQVRGLNLHSANASEIRELMLQVGIGIDCSGLVVHALNHYFRKHRRNFFGKLKFSQQGVRARLARWLRPVENIGANDLTSNLNCHVVSVQEVRPGDLLRGVGKQRNAYHVAIVVEVITGQEEGREVVREIKYVHSHRGYGSENGVRRGSVAIINPEGGFLEQNWTEVHTDGINYLLNDLTAEPQDSGFRRLIIT